MKTELLSPAGNLENLKIAIAYGADAVYLAGKSYGLRAKADNFSPEEMAEGVKYAHDLGKKVYVTLNIIPHNSDLEGLPEYIKKLKELNIDAVIAADPGVISTVKQIAPSIPIHLSTQANNTNYKSAQFWHAQGLKRITLARELSLEEIKEIIAKNAADLEFETFVHGSICISYSGRCMLSKYMAQRDANTGECTHPCRWLYKVVEEKRPGEYYDVYEDDKGSYIFNSKDLCLAEQVPSLIDAGVKSFKIEGRMKSSYYVAIVTAVYRKIIDEYVKNPESYKMDLKLIEELAKITHRKYAAGFINSKPGAGDYIYDSTGYISPYIYLGKVLSYDEKTKTAKVCLQNKMVQGDEIEVVSPGLEISVQKVTTMYNDNGEKIDSAPHSQQLISLKMDCPVKYFDLIRKKNLERGIGEI